ncbi:MAG TPA: 6-carboxytetrahydropterin synthase [Terriglobales bacterium]|nr:6-carboxytetrahydropterin synthase [Terriglobales bacterium]
MKAYLTRRYWFSASHRLHNDELSEEENRSIYGKCNNPHGHGHNYALEVTVSGHVNPSTGMVCDLTELDSVVEREIIGCYGHEHLNALPQFEGVVPTSENLALQIFDILKRKFHAAHLERVKLDETSQNSFQFAGGRELR